MDMTILKVLGSYLVARSRWADWWLRIIMRTMFDAVAKPITSGIELCRATAPTALPMDHATEADNMEPTRACSRSPSHSLANYVFLGFP